MYPFVRERRVSRAFRRRLRTAFADRPSFEFALTRVGRFPDVVYLAPEPARPFIALTERCEATWPEHTPYGGEYEETVPHLTVVDHAPEPPDLVERLTRLLPMAARADALWVMAPGRRGWRRIAAVQLSSG